MLHLAGEDHTIGDAQRGRELGQLDVGVVAVQRRLVRPADDQELGTGDPGQRPQQRLERLALGQVRRGEQTRPAVPLGHRAFRGEQAGVDAPGHDPD